MTFRRFPDGFEIALLPPPRLLTSRKELFWSILAGGLAVLVGAGMLKVLSLIAKDDKGCVFGFTICFSAGLALTPLLVVLSQLNWNRGTAVLEARNGLLTIVRSGGYPPSQWSLSDIASVRAWPIGDDDRKWALQITRKNRDVHLTLDGRGKSELDWVAGLLRAAVAPPRRPAPVAAAPVVYLSGGECQVCGWTMEQRVVLCSKCRTPLHQECWTYGCREIRCTRTA